MTKPSITDNKAVDKKENMDIIRNRSIGSGRLRRWPAFSSTNRLEKTNLIVKTKGRRRLHKEQETELPPVGGVAEVYVRWFYE